MFENEVIIHSYTRKEAIEDGVLVDVSKMATEAGFKYPVAVTRAVWDTIISPDERSRPYGQSEEGRLWDVLWMHKRAIRNDKNGSEIRFQLFVIFKEKQKRLVTLKALCHAGDENEPVITIMLPDED